MSYTNTCSTSPQVTINVVRKFRFFFQNVFVPIFAITTLSFCAFAVPFHDGGTDDPDDDGGFVEGYEGRAQVTLTLLLSSIAYKFYLNDMLAQAPYLTFIDWCKGLGTITSTPAAEPPPPPPPKPTEKSNHSTGVCASSLNILCIATAMPNSYSPSYVTLCLCTWPMNENSTVLSCSLLLPLLSPL